MGGIGRHEVVIGVGRHEVEGDRERGRHADLVLHGGGNRALRAEPREDPVIADRVFGVAGGEGQVRRVHPFADAQPFHRIDHLAVPLGEFEGRHGRVDFEVRMGLELIVDEADPAPAPAGLAVRQAAHVLAQRTAHGAERGFRVRKRQTADHVRREPARGFVHRPSSPDPGASVAAKAAACPAARGRAQVDPPFPAPYPRPP